MYHMCIEVEGCASHIRVCIHFCKYVHVCMCVYTVNDVGNMSVVVVFVVLRRKTKTLKGMRTAVVSVYLYL